MALIQIAQITYFILSRHPCIAGLSLHISRHSCNPPAGQRKPHHSRPKNTEKMSMAANTIKLPFTICSELARIMRYGEKYHIVIGNKRKEPTRIVFLILWRIISKGPFFQHPFCLGTPLKICLIGIDTKRSSKIIM